MARSVIATGIDDAILPAEEIPARLLAHIPTEGLEPELSGAVQRLNQEAAKARRARMTRRGFRAPTRSTAPPEGNHG